MNKSDWDTLSEHPKRGKPAWGKALMGCGIVVLVLLGGCICFAFWASGPGKVKVKTFFSEKVEQALEKPWGRTVAVIDSMQTDDGALKLYSDNPALKTDYPTEKDFLKSAAIWRSKVTGFPRTPPSIEELNKSNFQFNSDREYRGKWVKVLEIGYGMPNNTNIRMRWEDDELVELEIK
jgi:hypothetical protein